MLMVVFGAGATHDSSPDHPPGANAGVEDMRPPLTKDLFNVTAHNRRAVDRFGAN